MTPITITPITIIKNGKEIRAVECKLKETEVSFKEFLKKYKEAKVEVVTPESFFG